MLNVVKTYGFSSSIYSWSRLFFMLKNCLLEITRHFMYCLSYIVAKKNFVIFFQALRHHCAPFNRFYKVFRTCISKIVCYVRETRELYQWKFKVYRLCRMLKIQETICFAKVSLIKQFNSIDLSCCDIYY